jgi:hypothetical protein
MDNLTSQTLKKVKEENEFNECFEDKSTEDANIKEMRGYAFNPIKVLNKRGSTFPNSLTTVGGNGFAKKPTFKFGSGSSHPASKYKDIAP